MRAGDGRPPASRRAAVGAGSRRVSALREGAHEVPQNPKGTEDGPHVRTHTDTRVLSASTLRYRRRGSGTEAREGECRNFRAGGPTKRSEIILCFTAISWRQGERGRAKVRPAPRNQVRL